MPAKPNKPNPAATLRSRAEERLGERVAEADESDARRIVHELEVHQIELEIQNADLRAARDEAETLLGQYTELYDFAPVGYFTLSREGIIRLANLTGASMVGIERSKLNRRSFRMLLAPDQRKSFKDFNNQVFAGDEKLTADFELANRKLAIRTINIEARRSRDGLESSTIIRDVTALRIAAETASRNVRLSREIDRRKKIESNLQAQRKEQSRIIRQARMQEKQLREFSHRILHAQEEERKLISRELHDVIAQTLVSINMHLEVLAQGNGPIPLSLKKQISKTQMLVEKAVKIIHDFARQLRPAMLDDLGLIPALQMYIHEFTANSGIHVSLSAFSGIDKLRATARTALYRVAQEALTNVARHANASNVEVHIKKLGNVIRMTIIDNGIGFESEKATGTKKKNRLGLIGMKERAEMISGKFEVTSKTGGPTTLSVEIPNTAYNEKRLR